MVKPAPSPQPSPDAFVNEWSARTREIADVLRALIKRSVPDVVERAHPGWRILGYRARRGGREAHFAYIGPHADFATLGFEYGAVLDDPHHLLEDENLKQVRFITVRAPDDPRLPLIADMIRQAADVALLPKAMRDMMRRG